MHAQLNSAGKHHGIERQVASRQAGGHAVPKGRVGVGRFGRVEAAQEWQTCQGFDICIQKLQQRVDRQIKEGELGVGTQHCGKAVQLVAQQAQGAQTCTRKECAASASWLQSSARLHR